MQLIESKQWLSSFKNKWLVFSWIKMILLSVSCALVFSTFINHFLLFSFWICFLTITIAANLLLWFFSRLGKIDDKDIFIYLNQHFPVLEESVALVYAPIESLSFLQKLQASKVNKILAQLPQPKGYVRKLKSGFLFLLGALIISFLITKLPNGSKLSSISTSESAKAKIIKDLLPPEIDELRVQIIPPSYTNLKEVNQDQFSLKIANASALRWEISTNSPLKSLRFIFNDKEYLQLKPLNKERTLWSAAKIINQSGFYQVELDGEKSDLYQIETIIDQPVAIKIIKPEPQSVIDIGQPQQVNLSVLLADDYGIKDAYIAATITSGKGEGVSFKEQKIMFNSVIYGKQQTINQLINLKKLGMKPGDELYFFVKAMDNHGQESRSDIYTIAIQDTSELMSLTGMMGGVNLVPEYFRSQRQIIIDTEKLLKERGVITDSEFKNRSNNLGMDQKLLRLRYGKFLGEESETYGSEGDGDKHTEDDGHDHSQNANAKFGDVQSLMDEYAHKHDNAEDASFFEPELKSKLKATLTEMWTAELKLRTFQTQEALPYEYKALRLLKDLQQSSRAYVAKTTVKTTPLKAEKRLSGELDEITNPVRKADMKLVNLRESILRNAISMLEQWKQKGTLTASEIKILKDVQLELTRAATKNPAEYLPVLKLIQKVSSQNTRSVTSSEINKIENALQKLTNKPQLLPQARSGETSSAIGKSYFENLKNSNKN